MQQRVLVRARGLAAFRRALVEVCLEGPALAARRRVVVVPTRAAAELLRQTLEDSVAGAGRQAAMDRAVELVRARRGVHHHRV